MFGSVRVCVCACACLSVGTLLFESFNLDVSMRVDLDFG